MNRWAKTLDANHLEIVEHLRKSGLEVLDLSRVGQGCPDILVSDTSHMWLFEIKTEKGKLKKSQEKFLALWKGKKIHIVRSADEIFKIIAASFG
jgi:Holliday junction resolvase